MNTALKCFALALLATACGPPWSNIESGGETSSTQSSSQTSTTETEDSASSSTSSNSGAFLPAAPDLPIPCDPFAQDCPEGQKCVPYSSTGEDDFDDHKCVPVLGENAPGEPCTYAGTLESTDDCDATSFCWNVIEGVGVCYLFCLGETDEDILCPENHSCSISASSDVYLCIPQCNPVAQDCDDDLACYWANNGFNCLPTMGGIPTGQPCGYINDCVEGNGCLTAEVLPDCAGSACCSPWCLFGGNGQECAALPGTTCISFFEENMAPPGYDDVGVCIVP